MLVIRPPSASNLHQSICIVKIMWFGHKITCINLLSMDQQDEVEGDFFQLKIDDSDKLVVSPACPRGCY